MMIIENARWVKNGDWYEARDPQENRLMFRVNPSQMMIEWGYRRRIVVADLCQIMKCQDLPKDNY